MAQACTRILTKWRAGEAGAALPEFALLFPVLLAMIMGMFDIGRAVTINQKVISSAQIIADLITRNQSLNAADLDEIVLAGQMAMDPYDRDPMGYDIVSVEYDEDGAPMELWRVTDNMLENETAFERTEGLGDEGEGVVAVTVAYTYAPYFTSFIEDQVFMQEVAILRGRRSAVVTCEDC